MVPNHHARKVLIVDDNQIAADSLALVLLNSGFDTLTTDSGGSALAIADREQPDYGVLNGVLPDLDETA